ncbi:MAG: hypothetical protein WBQ23_10125 [Bacteroidota bacterium]
MDTSGSITEDRIEFSHLINLHHGRFCTKFKPGDKLFFESIKEDAVSNSTLRQVALVNTEEVCATSSRRTWTTSSSTALIKTKESPGAS